MRVLVFGKNGQVATELQQQSGVIALGREVMDFRYPERFEAVIDQYCPDVIINATAYTDVNGAENNEKLATKINGIAPTILAEIAAKRKIPFLHISTDYVFDGSGNSPWTPLDQPCPLNAYGRSKLKGETGITQTDGVFAILRTSWVFSSSGKNFVKTVLELSTIQDEIKVVSDEIGGPTAASDLASALMTIANTFNEARGESGIFHFAGSPDTSWANFALNVTKKAGASVKIIHVPSSEIPTRAIRPLNSRMDCSKLQNVFGINRPKWQDSLDRVIDKLTGQNCA